MHLKGFGKFLLRAWRALWLGGTVILGLGLVGGWVSTWVNPADFWWSALFGLVFPWLLLANVVLIVLLLLFRPRYALIPTVAILLCVPLLVRFLQFRAPSEPYVGEVDLSVMSYNVNLFKLYSWSGRTPTFNEVAELCREQGADVVCLQEYYTHDELFAPASAERLFGTTNHVHYAWHRHSGHYGMATFSRFPIVGRGEIHFDNSVNATIFTDILVGDDTIRIYNNHLQSFRLNPSNLDFIRSPRLNSEPETLRQIAEISGRLARAFTMRAQQVDKVKQHIDRSPYPVIVCGDFNDSPISYTYTTMGKTLSDAFRDAGDGLGATYRGFVPSFRIDYMLYSPVHLRVLDFHVTPADYSDHYPIHAKFRVVN